MKKREILTSTKAASRKETLISTETPVKGEPTVAMAAAPTKSTSEAVAPPCKVLAVF